MVKLKKNRDAKWLAMRVKNNAQKIKYEQQCIEN